MADDGMIWAVATQRGQTADRAWHTPEDGPFQVERELFTDYWMRKATPAELREALGGDPAPAEPAPVKALGDMTDDELAVHYEAVMGERPHHAAKRETLVAKITEKLNAD